MKVIVKVNVNVKSLICEYIFCIHMYIVTY